ncbi:hypothetical protein QCA50_015982 [Cerrena zonata]|uniref:ABC transporter domain-containing protein n=1 Tax=Cerrena zonata TaxID=2478898 RepID=A0AAW0FJX4_9APHY
MEYWKKAVHEIAQTFIVKYFWGAAGLVLCSAPVFINKYWGEEPDPSASDRLIYSRRYLLQVVGHATRVADLQDVLYKIKSSKNSIVKDEGNVSYGDEVTFKDVRLVTPADVTLIEKLNFSIKPGQHLLIAGPNGSGKSSLFRMLGGLWPCKEELLTSSNDKNPWDSVRNWSEELSVGAQQRLAMARLYYHQPKFAVLDECTSAVSPSMEQFMYKRAQELGISLLSVAHRPALWHFHNYLLKFDGKGGYFFGELDAEKRLRFEEERLVLEKNLRDVPVLKERLAELRKVSNAQHLRYEKSHKNLTELASH